MEMMTALVVALAFATGSQPLALRVEVQPLGRGGRGTVMGVGVQVAPEDRGRAGGRVRVGVTLARAGKTLDSSDAVVEMQADGSLLVYREWPAGDGEVRVSLETLDGASRGGWTGKVKVPEMAAPFELPVDAPADAVALAPPPAATGVVRFAPPPQQGGLGAVQLELDVPEATRRVEFFQDESLLVSRQRAPWTVSVALGEVARRTTVRGVAYDATGEYLGEDAVVLNAAGKQIPVELLVGPAPKVAGGDQTVTVAVGSRAVGEVVLRLDDKPVGRWTSCPCVMRLPAAEVQRAKVISAEATGPGGLRGEAVKVQGLQGYQENVRVEVVELPVTVLDGQGRLVTDLPRDAFSVQEDGVEVAVDAFANTGELPLAVGLLVDVSGSMRETFPAVRRAVSEFASDLVRPGDSAFLMTFSWETAVRIGWTGDAGVFGPALERVTPDGGTALHDAVIRGLEMFRGRRGRVALVLLSDGDDTTSRTGWDVALRFVKTARTPIFPVGFRLGVLDIFTKGMLRDLATATGGEAFFAPKSGDLAEAYRRIGEQLRAQYLLTYRSPSVKGAEHFRNVRVSVGRPGLVARTIAGYYPAM